MKKKLLIIISLMLVNLNLQAMDYFSSSSFNLKGELQKANKDKNGNNSNQNQKFSYKDLVEYLKNSDDPNQTMILGILYSKGSQNKDDFGEEIDQDIALSEKYLRLSAQKGNYMALTVLGGLILYNEDMRRLDPELIQTQKDLELSYGKGVLEAGVLLTTTLFEKKEWKKGLKILIDASSKGDSVAQLQTALIFKQGLKDGNDKENKEFIIKPKEEVALYYLNLACSNEKKNKKVKEFCFNKENISIERKNK